MVGIKDIELLVKNLNPTLHKVEWVFCTSKDPIPIGQKEIMCLFKEPEGYSYILPKSTAISNQMTFEGTFAMITLNVQSSLQSIGLTALVSKALSAALISCNVVAAFHHDHLFVPYADRKVAIKVLKDLSKQKIK
jgi:hypothetical protein